MTEAGKRLVELLRRRAERNHPGEIIQPDPGPGLDERAAMVAGLRALAQLLEERPEVPCPRTIDAQHTVLPRFTATGEKVPLPDDAKIAAVREIATALGIWPLIDDTRAGFRYPLGGNVYYVVGTLLDR